MTATLESTRNEGLEVPSDEDRMAAMYAEHAGEDRELAEDGIADYADALAKEDAL